MTNGNVASIAGARERGRALATAALQRRAEARVEARGRALTSAAPMAEAALPTRVVLAEGDSWFDYPWTDVLEVLEDDHGYDVESLAHRGDRIEDMAYQDGQLGALIRRLEKLIRRGTPPVAILLSGGGNDVAGDELANLLNHRQSSAPGLNPLVVDGVLQRIKLAYAAILEQLTFTCESMVGAPIRIVIHGYDYAVPDGRGFLGGWGPLPGPWLEPGFRSKGYDDLEYCKGVVRELIDGFNAALVELVEVPAFQHVSWVDLRNSLPNDPASYRMWWADELHPSREGFAVVARRFAHAIQSGA